MKKLKYLLAFIISFAINPAAHASFTVETDWLAKHLNDKNIVLIDMSDGMQYQRFHIPGAIHLPYNVLNNRTPKGVSLSVGTGQVIRFLGLLGIKRDNHVIIYDDTGALNASRLFWELQRIKHEKISILNGGLVKWILENRKVSNKVNEPVATSYLPSSADFPELLASLDDLDTSKATLLDVRSAEEYKGHPRQPRSGHIPGAKWWGWDSSVDFNNGFTQKPTAELIESLEAIGVNSKKQPLVVYCRSGHRAAQSYFTLKNLGYSNVRLYDGSMAEYEQSKKPLKMGPNP